MQVNAIGNITQILDSKSIKVLAGVAVGDVIKAQVVAKTDDGITLQLEDGRVINATTIDNLNAVEGKFVELMLKERRDGQVSFETVSSQTFSQEIDSNKIKNLLCSLNISVSANTFDIAEEMIKKQIPLTKENFQNIMSGLLKNPGLDVPKAVFMIANSLPIKEENISILKQYSEGKIQLGNQIKDLISMIGSIDEPQTINNIYKAVTESEGKIAEKAINSFAKALITQTEAKNFQLPISETDLKNDVIQTGKNSEGKANALNIKNQLLDNNLFESVKALIANKAAQMQKNEMQKVGVVKADLQNAEMQNTQNQNTEKLNFIKTNIANAIKNMDLDEFVKVVETMPKADIGVLKALIETKKNELAIFKADYDNIIDGKKVLLKEHFNRFYIDVKSEKLQEDINPGRLYDDLFSQLRAIKEALQTYSKAPELIDSINKTQDNIKFLNNFNQYNSFVQIPLNISGNYTTADLYVLKNKKKKIDPNNASLFLSLDMPNMGLTEVLVNVKGKNINLNFRMENQETAMFLKKNSGKLIDSLSARGYSFINVEATLLAKRTPIEERDKLLDRKDEKKYATSFDIKI